MGKIPHGRVPRVGDPGVSWNKRDIELAPNYSSAFLLVPHGLLESTKITFSKFCEGGEMKKTSHC